MALEGRAGVTNVITSCSTLTINADVFYKSLRLSCPGNLTAGECQTDDAELQLIHVPPCNFRIGSSHLNFIHIRSHTGPASIMWVLECEGDLFRGECIQEIGCGPTLTPMLGRKLWLKPGSKYLFGRTSGELGPNEREHARRWPDIQSSTSTDSHIISNKSVSRKHLVFSVEPVPRGAGVCRLHRLSKSPL